MVPTNYHGFLYHLKAYMAAIGIITGDESIVYIQPLQLVWLIKKYSHCYKLAIVKNKCFTGKFLNVIDTRINLFSGGTDTESYTMWDLTDTGTWFWPDSFLAGRSVHKILIVLTHTVHYTISGTSQIVGPPSSGTQGVPDIVASLFLDDCHKSLDREDVDNQMIGFGTIHDNLIFNKFNIPSPPPQQASL